MDSLPIDALHSRFREVCTGGCRLVVSAPTGSGKSTRLPWWMADALGGPVLVVEPRRVAARALATHGAKIRGESVGERVGYRVRFDAAESAQTEILFVTPGMALAMLARDEGRRFVGVLVDEFHERGWETDLVTALVHDRRVGTETALVVCSATLARDALSTALDATVLSGEGRAFEVAVRHAGAGGPSVDGLAERVRDAVEVELAETSGDVLVFLPGKREIAECKAALRAPGDVDVLPLHGGLPPAEMQRALGPARRRRVFLATNVAETSLTIPSVTSVVDGGLERRHVHRRGKIVLSVVPISVASAEQRRGRAGRVQAGRCVRLWSSAFVLDAHTPPQIERVGLDDVLLRGGMCGVRPSEVASLPWVTAPPRFAVDAALEHLRQCGAVDEGGALTPAGRVQASLPVSWVGARMLTEPPPALAWSLCELVAVMEVGRDLLANQATPRQLEAREDLLEGSVDEVDVALRCIRLGDAQLHGLRARPLGECRRLARSLQRVVNAKKVPAPEHGVLARWIAGQVPELVFARRPRADRTKREGRRSGADPWGNGELEVFVYPFTVPTAGDPPKPPQAGLVLEREWLGIGQKARGVGRLLMRLQLSDLAELGLGEAEVDRLRVKGGKVVADVVRTFAGVNISTGTEVLRGDRMLDALVELVLRGTLMKGTAKGLLDALHAWDVLWQWGKRERVVLPEPPSDPPRFLRQRLVALGVESAGDLSLLELDDLVPDLTAVAVSAGMDPREAVSLPEQFPRFIEVPGGRYACSVSVASRCVELTPDKGTKKEPSAGLLPRFAGFSVVFVKASRRVTLR